MASTFFQKEAYEKLSTPEKLDQLIKIISPKSWIFLLTLALVIGTALGWAIFGTVKTKLNAVGVLLGGEIHEVVSTSQGQLISMKVNLGDRVEEGDIVASIEQPELYQQIGSLEAVLMERQLELKALQTFGIKDTELQREFVRQQKASIDLQMRSDKKNISFLENQLASELVLLEKGLVTKAQVANTEQLLEGAKNSLERLKSQLVQSNSQKLNLDFELKQRITVSKQRINEAERQLMQLKERYDIQSNIRSAHSGEVVELLTEAGVVVLQGTSLFKLKNYSDTEDKLRGVLYIPAQDGKKIKDGMQALVAPSTIQPQEYGFMKGKVTYVSEFPVTQQGMLTTVKNMQLVQGLLSQGALFEVYVEFEKDNASFSGYQWTSAGGPPVLINEGTSCIGKITAKKEAPIVLVIPALKKFFDLY